MKAEVRLNLPRLERVLSNAGATCEDPDNRRGPLFCGHCGAHDDECPCDDCELHDEDCDMGIDCPCGGRKRRHRCELTRALEEVRAAVKFVRSLPRHLHWSRSDPTALCGTGFIGPGLRVHYTKARKTDCHACRRVFRASVSRPAKF